MRYSRKRLATPGGGERTAGGRYATGLLLQLPARGSGSVALLGIVPEEKMSGLLCTRRSASVESLLQTGRCFHHALAWRL
jgi:hypothetical protein